MPMVRRGWKINQIFSKSREKKATLGTVKKLKINKKIENWVCQNYVSRVPSFSTWLTCLTYLLVFVPLLCICLSFFTWPTCLHFFTCLNVPSLFYVPYVPSLFLSNSSFWRALCAFTFLYNVEQPITNRNKLEKTRTRQSK